MNTEKFQNSCPSGLTPNSIGICTLNCPDGYFGNEKTAGQCLQIPDCSAYNNGVDIFAWNNNYLRCDNVTPPKPSCPVGQVYINGVCTPCPVGTTYSSDGPVCLPNSTRPDRCPEGTAYSLTTGTCVPRCSEGTAYSLTTGTCVPDSTPRCPEGTAYSQTTGTCVSTTPSISCPNGTTYSQTTGTCVSTTPSISCPNGTIFSSTTGSCIPSTPVMPVPTPVINSIYSCPPGWKQYPTDSLNGNCVAPCAKTSGGSNTFNYGPKFGGYPINRRSGTDMCIDLTNGSNQSQAFNTRSPIWPPEQVNNQSSNINLNNKTQDKPKNKPKIYQKNKMILLDYQSV